MCIKCHAISLAKGHWHCACDSVLSFFFFITFTPVLCIFFIDVQAYCLSIILKKQKYYLDTSPFSYCPLQGNCSQELSKFTIHKSSSSILQSDFHCQYPLHLPLSNCLQYLTNCTVPSHRETFHYLASSTQLSLNFFLLPLTHFLVSFVESLHFSNFLHSNSLLLSFYSGGLIQSIL